MRHKLSEHNPIELLNDMATFVRVAQYGGFSSAAQALALSPSAVSKQITRLERRLGVQLLARSTRTMRLTEVGQEVLLHAQTMLHSAQSAQAVAQLAMTQPCGHLVVSAPKAFARSVLQALIPEFLMRYPQISLQMMVSDISAEAIPEGVDCAMMITEYPPELCIAKALRPIRQVLCASPDYLQTQGMPQHPQDLTTHQCIALGETPSDRRWLLECAGQSVKIMVQGRYTVNHSEMRLDALVHGLGIGSLPEFVAQEALRSGQLVEVLADWRLLSKYQGSLWLAYAPNRFVTPALSAWMDFVKQHLSSPKAQTLSAP